MVARYNCWSRALLCKLTDLSITYQRAYDVHDWQNDLLCCLYLNYMPPRALIIIHASQPLHLRALMSEYSTNRFIFQPRHLPRLVYPCIHHRIRRRQRHPHRLPQTHNHSPSPSCAPTLQTTTFLQKFTSPPHPSSALHILHDP